MAEEWQDKKHLTMLIGRQIAFMVYAFFKVNDDQGRATSMTTHDNLKKFEQFWEETPMVLEKEPERDLLGGILFLLSTVWEVDSHAKRFGAEAFRSYSRFKAMVPDVLDDEQQTSIRAQKRSKTAR